MKRINTEKKKRKIQPILCSLRKKENKEKYSLYFSFPCLFLLRKEKKRKKEKYTFLKGKRYSISASGDGVSGGSKF
jgi:hypothetical protein